MSGFADVDGFKSCVQDCVLPGFPLLVFEVITLQLLSVAKQPSRQFTFRLVLCYCFAVRLENIIIFFFNRWPTQFPKGNVFSRVYKHNKISLLKRFLRS